MKRTISIILSVMMILSSFVGVSAFAVTTETCSIEYVSAENVTISNTDKTVKKGDSYVATITSNIVKNFDGMDVRAMMGDQVVYPQKITDESYKIIISKVTDDVKIIAKAYEKTADTTEVIGNSRYISISRNLVNCTSSGKSNIVLCGGHYSEIITPNDGYKLTTVIYYGLMKEDDGDYYYQQYICKDNGDGTYYVSCDKEINIIYAVAEPISSDSTTTEPTTVPIVKGKISLSKNSLTLAKTNKNISTKLVATVTPNELTNKRVIWSSSNSKVAKVDKNGKVTTVSNGFCTITAKLASDNTIKSICKVKVVQKATKIKLNVNNKTLKKGSAYTLKATVNPNTTSNKKVTWKTNKKAVATVNSKGRVIAKKKGTAIITATTADGSKKSAKCKITVK